MASDSVHRENAGPAFQELEALVRRLGEELAGFRRRALHAEAQLKTQETIEPRGDDRADEDGAPARKRRGADDRNIATLERENVELRTRLESATERTRQMLDRVRFLRQQQDIGAEK